MEYRLEYVHSEYQLYALKPSTHPPISPNSPQTISLLISYSCTNRVWKLRHHLSPHFLLSDARLPDKETTVVVNLNELHRHDETYAAIEDGIKAWPISTRSRQKLIEGAVRRAQVAVQAPLARTHDDVCVKILFDVVRNQVVRQLQPNLGRTIPETVGRCCSVCLEEFCEAWEGVYIPCSHVFHQDCIQKWLRVNHSCPLCRFQMPTRTGFRIDFKISENSSHLVN